MFRQHIACHHQGALVVLAKITIKHAHARDVRVVAAYRGSIHDRALTLLDPSGPAWPVKGVLYLYGLTGHGSFIEQKPCCIRRDILTQLRCSEQPSKRDAMLLLLHLTGQKHSSSSDKRSPQI